MEKLPISSETTHRMIGPERRPLLPRPESGLSLAQNSLLPHSFQDLKLDDDEKRKHDNVSTTNATISTSDPTIMTEALYVSPKQYARILKRRVARERLVELLPNVRTQYLYQRHGGPAKRRPRGPGGRFLKTPDGKLVETLEEIEEARALAEQEWKLEVEGRENDGIEAAIEAGVKKRNEEIRRATGMIGSQNT